MNREEKKALIVQIENIFKLLDYFNQHLGINTFDAKLEIGRIQSLIIDLYHESLDNPK